MAKLLSALFVGLAFAASAASSQAIDLAKALQGKLIKVSGNETIDHTLQGKPKFYVVYHSADWCSACKRVTPELVRAYANLSKQKVNQVEMILIDYDKNAKEMSRYMVKSKINFPGLKFEANKGHQTSPVATLTKVEAFPTIVLADANGKVLAEASAAEPILAKVNQLTK